MKLTCLKKRPHGRARGGFTRIDLIVAAALAAVLIGYIALLCVGERGRAMRCAWNLRSLHGAMEGYASDHRHALPAASVNVDKAHSSWDVDIFPYLGSGLKKKDNADLSQIVPKYFCCPSDRLQHSGTARSYSMSGHNMQYRNWPPGPECATGVGLNWDAPAVLRLLNAEALKQPENLPGVEISSIPEPAQTLLLTEALSPDNLMGKPNMASISGSAQQTRLLPQGGMKFHGGRFNYLMVDGHVERLTFVQAGSLDGGSGIWTMKKEH
jgi:prepilin-type processing-associated H-X9-DG protein